MESFPTLLPANPPNYTEDECQLFDALLRRCQHPPFFAVSESMFYAIKEYAAWKALQT